MSTKEMAGNDLVRELVKTLNLPKGTVSFELLVAKDSLVEVKCKYYAETDTDRLTVLMDQYTLHKK